jgi:hypothetical protein
MLGCIRNVVHGQMKLYEFYQHNNNSSLNFNSRYWIKLLTPSHFKFELNKKLNILVGHANM